MLSFSQFLIEKAPPKIFKRLVSQLKAKGLPTAAAYATANKKLKGYGITTKGGKLTKKGKKRNAMSAGDRAKDREAKRQGKSTKSFTYSKKTNRATLKDR
jgi:hypothetical protein